MAYFKGILIDKSAQLGIQDDYKTMDDILKQNKIEHTSTQISKSHHLRSLKHGFQIQYKNDQVQTFFAYFRTKKFSNFQGNLPFRINDKWTLRTAILFFGEPSLKSKHIVQVIYQNLGLGLVFQGLWTNDDAIIDYCYFYEPSGLKICSNCKKQTQHFIWKCQCKAVAYCSDKCKQTHIGLHNTLCQQIDQ